MEGLGEGDGSLEEVESEEEMGSKTISDRAMRLRPV